MTEAEEIYKLIQNKHSEWEAGKLPSMPTRPKSGQFTSLTDHAVVLVLSLKRSTGVLFCAAAGRPKSAGRKRSGRGSDEKHNIAMQAAERKLGQWRAKFGPALLEHDSEMGKSRIAVLMRIWTLTLSTAATLNPVQRCLRESCLLSKPIAFMHG